ncbi:siderophore-interacting protein [Alteromonas lipolytica]|uniref:FAD-binding FR-type domain-containing protein n=1 Tax=Alteromonas lipolytica TaxID=1856405 RepID=A0A1E8FB08_9ALTE|nr:siderophore-interacting protein [Alteromonas lipolytica]OFI33117.1 hypothetical protein BFC17_02315 [Alteromonas lipolytica]GGF62326.1 siderophore-interacting protein [Alteromonas lipolytica]
MKKRQYYTLEVLRTERVSPNLQRLVLTGDDLMAFPAAPPGSYIKLLFNQYGEPQTSLPQEDQKILMRTYTVRHLDPQARTLTVDFMLHGDGVEAGPASHWAQTAKVGDVIVVAGPGSSKGLAEQRDWVILLGDMTALPAISAQLEAMPKDTRGYVIINIVDAADQQSLTAPEGVEISWLTQPTSSGLAKSLHDVQWLEGTPAVWAACEFSSMRAIRSTLDVEFNVPRSQVYVTSYWREGRSEDQHKIDKRKDVESYNAAVAG